MITIVKHLRDLLIDNSHIKSKIDTKIFPLVAPENTKSPFVTIVRDSYKPEYTKGNKNIDCVVSVFVLSNDYAESVEITELIVNALENKRIEEIDVRIIQIEEIQEDFDEEFGIYIQRIIIKIK